MVRENVPSRQWNGFSMSSHGAAEAKSRALMVKRNRSQSRLHFLVMIAFCGFRTQQSKTHSHRGEHINVSTTPYTNRTNSLDLIECSVVACSSHAMVGPLESAAGNVEPTRVALLLRRPLRQSARTSGRAWLFHDASTMSYCVLRTTEPPPASFSHLSSPPPPRPRPRPRPNYPMLVPDPSQH